MTALTIRSRFVIYGKKVDILVDFSKPHKKLMASHVLFSFEFYQATL
jgi:hypothetical protein